MGRLEGKSTVVTGASSGIGRATALLFAKEGANVVCVSRSGAEETAEAIGDAAVGLRGDVSVTADVVRMIETAEHRWGRLDVLVNNAGFGGVILPLIDQTEESFDQVIAVNLKGVFLGMKYGIPAILRSGGGSVVNVASFGGLTGVPGIGPYAGAKAGAVNMTKTAALDYAEENVRVNIVCPGPIWTPMAPAFTGEPTPPPDFRGHAPIGRWGMPEEVAAVILFLASAESSFVTGAAIPVDGGMAAGQNFPKGTDDPRLPRPPAVVADD